MTTCDFTTSGSSTVPTADHMRAFGMQLGATLRPGDLVILDGPLGAGKTTLVQGIGAGMDVRGRITSPTFTLAREHRPNTPLGCPLVHVDCYRLLDSGADVLGAFDALDLDTDLADCAVVVEWGEGLVEQLAEKYLLVTIEREHDCEQRTVHWRPVHQSDKADN